MNVFDFAMEIERAGRKFYRDMARRAATPGVRTIYGMMAEDEEALLGKLRALRAATPATVMDSSAIEHAGGAFGRIFDAGEALRISDDLAAYAFVMEVEARICRLYEEAARSEGNPEVRSLLLKIAAEERRELESLEKVYDFVNAPNTYLAWGEFSNLNEYHNFGRDVT